jgi:hypothetical protein
MEKLLEGFLHFLLKQAFSVVLLTVFLLGVLWYFDRQEAKFDRQLAAMAVELKTCAETHEKDSKTITELSVKVGILQERVNILAGQKR